MKVNVLTLGCHKNLVDSEVMLGKLAHSYEIVDTPEEADLMVINTCAFIDKAREEAVAEILDAVELKNEGIIKYLVVAGCLTERYSEDLIKEIPEIDAVLGVNEAKEISAIVEKVLRNEKKLEVNHEEKLYDSHDERTITTGGHSAYIKIAEGCDNRCSFCIIPFIRGKYRSRTIEDIVEEVKNLVSKGIIEFNLIAQDTTEYGSDIYGERKISELLNRLCEIEGVVWIRLFYTYPHIFTRELIETMKNQPKICRYIDIPVQHGATSVLMRMNRKDSGEETLAKLEEIRRELPDSTIRTTLIVGFPGETKDEYEKLKSLVEEFKFDYAGIFTYSQEEGTVAGKLDGQLEETIKQERLVELTNLQTGISHLKNQSKVGTIQEVIVDEAVDGGWYQYEGRMRSQAMDIDGKVLISTSKDLPIGSIVNVSIDEVVEYDFTGELVDA
ncbi:MAG: 30S ribosomal protein S12 methylthiotransferase RimO [Fusobacteria bacterium]|nr:30S ribosomal protein S12 methylthiotransferase RimO [Fusobacteriota bacterium]